MCRDGGLELKMKSMPPLAVTMAPEVAMMLVMMVGMVRMVMTIARMVMSRVLMMGAMLNDDEDVGAAGADDDGDSGDSDDGYGDGDDDDHRNVTQPTRPWRAERDDGHGHDDEHVDDRNAMVSFMTWTQQCMSHSARPTGRSWSASAPYGRPVHPSAASSVVNGSRILAFRMNSSLHLRFDKFGILPSLRNESRNGFMGQKALLSSQLCKILHKLHSEILNRRPACRWHLYSSQGDCRFSASATFRIARR